MKKIVLIVLLLAFSVVSFAQKASVEKSTFGIQTGYLGIWGYNEARLSNSIVLRSEVGVDAAIWGSTNIKTGFLLTPVLNLNPKWYYNLKRRVAKGKRIDGNSGNYLSLETMFHPDLFVISNKKGISVYNSISFIPNWGIRRNIGQHVNYELGLGVAFTHTFRDKSNGLLNAENYRNIYIRLRIGYSF
jgi:hypothetical protein